MKKETFNLTLRFIAGLAAALILVGGIALVGEKMEDGRSGLLYQASGIPTTETMMTIEGQKVSAEEYFYYLVYHCDMVTSMGITDLDMEIGEGITAADYIAQQSVGAVTNRAVVEAWAKEAGITMTADEKADMKAQLDGVDYAAMGLSRRFLEEQVRYQYLSDHIITAYTTEGGKLYPSAEDIAAGMAAGEAHGHEHDEATVVMELCNEEFAERCNNAQIVYNEKLNGKVNVKEFYENLTAINTPAQ